MLPEQYQRHAPPTGQRPIHPATVQLRNDQDPIVHVPDPYDPQQSVAVRRSALVPVQRTEPRDLTPPPLLDPLAQRWVGAGAGIGLAGAGVGWGVGQMFAGIALMGTGGLAFLVGLLLAVHLVGGRSVTHVRQDVTVHQRAGWFGRNTTSW